MKSWNEMSRDAKDARRATPCDVPPSHRRRKDTKRWCGGHEGREHVYEWVPASRIPPEAGFTYGAGWYDKRCVKCGKKIDYCTKSFIRWCGAACKCGHHKS